jgi:antitoxin component HigA of HigAB toxin-antitoxin module
MLDLLIGRTDLSPGETDYLEGLTRFVEDYDQSHPIFADESNDALSRLKSLMEISGTTALQLGQILKSRSAASMVLRGTRELSKTHIRKLAAHFKLNPGYFF